MNGHVLKCYPKDGKYNEGTIEQLNFQDIMRGAISPSKKAIVLPDRPAN